MKRMKMLVLAGAVAVSSMAYGQGNSGAPATLPTPGSNQASDSSSAPPHASDMHDKVFLRKASEGGLAEVKLGELASTKGNSKEVKDFGSQMVTDHTKLNEEMKPIAMQFGVMPPQHLNKMDQAEWDKLNGMSGDDFDKEYITFMQKDHHNDLREFRTESNATQNEELKTAVEKGTKVIYHHTMMVDKIAKEMGISTVRAKKS